MWRVKKKRGSSDRNDGVNRGRIPSVQINVNGNSLGSYPLNRQLKGRPAVSKDSNIQSLDKFVCSATHTSKPCQHCLRYEGKDGGQSRCQAFCVPGKRCSKFSLRQHRWCENHRNMQVSSRGDYKVLCTHVFPEEYDSKVNGVESKKVSRQKPFFAQHIDSWVKDINNSINPFLRGKIGSRAISTDTVFDELTKIEKCLRQRVTHSIKYFSHPQTQGQAKSTQDSFMFTLNEVLDNMSVRLLLDMEINSIDSYDMKFGDKSEREIANLLERSATVDNSVLGFFGGLETSLSLIESNEGED
jgi:hypothetical protein